MSAKKGDLNLLIPGADGWEVWRGSSANGFQQHAATGESKVLNVTGIPAGPVAMAIPVRQVSAVPFRAQTDDLSLLGDLALMQLEKSGNRPALDGGQLTDHFVYGMADDETHLTAVVMIPPGEGQMPKKSPEAFDLSVRCLPLPEGGVAVWRELGRWVFAIGKPGQALYFQCLSGDQLDARAGNEISLALTQLQIQGMLAERPGKVVVWTNGTASDARPEEIEVLSRGLDLPVETVPRPAPGWPVPPSRLLPADVRAERLAGRAKRTRNVIIAAVAVLYLGLAGYLFLDLQKAQKKAATARREADAVQDEARLLADHSGKWNELEPVVETEFHPLEVFYACYQALPNEPNKRFIRLTKGVFENQFREVDGDLTVWRSIRLEGQSDQEDQPKIPAFLGALKKSDDLEAFLRWTFPGEDTDKRSGKLTFVFEGNATQ